MGNVTFTDFYGDQLSWTNWNQTPEENSTDNIAYIPIPDTTQGKWLTSQENDTFMANVICQRGKL